MPTWTFEMLAQADRKTLEAVLLAARAPDLEQLAGRVYDGYNHERLGQLPGEKFRKAFYLQGHSLYGFNQVVVQDGQHERGAWHTRMKSGKPAQRGFYRVTFARDEAHLQHLSYGHLAYFNYGIDLNSRWNVTMRGIRDYGHLDITCLTYVGSQAGHKTSIISEVVIPGGTSPGAASMVQSRGVLWKRARSPL